MRSSPGLLAPAWQRLPACPTTSLVGLVLTPGPEPSRRSREFWLTEAVHSIDHGRHLSQETQTWHLNPSSVHQIFPHPFASLGPSPIPASIIHIDIGNTWLFLLLAHVERAFQTRGNFSSMRSAVFLGCRTRQAEPHGDDRLGHMLLGAIGPGPWCATAWPSSVQTKQGGRRACIRTRLAAAAVHFALPAAIGGLLHDSVRQALNKVAVRGQVWTS